MARSDHPLIWVQAAGSCGNASVRPTEECFVSRPRTPNSTLSSPNPVVLPRPNIASHVFACFHFPIAYFNGFVRTKNQRRNEDVSATKSTAIGKVDSGSVLRNSRQPAAHSPGTRPEAITPAHQAIHQANARRPDRHGPTRSAANATQVNQSPAAHDQWRTAKGQSFHAAADEFNSKICRQRRRAAATAHRSLLLPGWQLPDHDRG